MSVSPSEPWEEGLPSASRTLRYLLRGVDSASAPLWDGPQLDAAVFRYAEIFLPMLAAHLGCGRDTTIGETTVRLAAIQKEANEKLACDYRIVKSGTMYKDGLSDDKEREAFLAAFLALGDDCSSAVPIPPLDVAFCWALHRLSPKDYEGDCMRLFGRKLETTNGLEYVNVGNAGDARSIVARLQFSCFSRAVRKREPSKFLRLFLPQYLWPRFTAVDVHDRIQHLQKAK